MELSNQGPGHEGGRARTRHRNLDQRRSPPDKRSYRVNFSLYARLAPDHQPIVDIGTAVLELKTGLEAMNFADGNSCESNYMRLKMLESHIRNGRLSDDLTWVS
ncbi:MAG: hypothetical protein GY807_13270 [Gammaproteobacteria bacterium]|nr:hypothetical protein [Gammaproteobacteria bacterium]